jgi:sugar O-acyltransferase (sialic acid O-acetyltransferase NeuD family)
MARVVIFGLQDNSSLAHFYLRHDSAHEVVAFTVNEAYLPADRRFEGLPVVPFEEIEAYYPTDAVSLFAPLAHRRMNRVRADVYAQIKARGYPMISYVSSKASVFPDALIGENCFILEDNTIQPYTRIGNNTVLWSGNHFGHHGIIRDHVYVTSHVVISGHCDIGDYCFLGVNATLRNGIALAEGTLAGMGVCLARDTEPWSVYMGNPAKKRDVRSDEVDF